MMNWLAKKLRLAAFVAAVCCVPRFVQAQVPVKVYEQQQHIDAPFTPKAAIVDTKVSIFADGVKLKTRVNIVVRNASCIDAVRGVVIVTLFDNDRELGRYVLEAEECAGKGWPWHAPVTRGAEREVELAPHGNLTHIRVETRNANHGNVLVHAAKFAPILLGDLLK